VPWYSTKLNEPAAKANVVASESPIITASEIEHGTHGRRFLIALPVALETLN
jgi:hypothetical protein